MVRLKTYILFFILAIAFTNLSCNSIDTVKEDTIQLIDSYSVNVKEPSGLTINDAGTILYTVSDNTGDVYKLSTTGNVLQTYSYGGNDLEGVSFVNENKLLLAEERTKELIEFNTSSGSFTKHKIDYNNEGGNKGIEGVAFNKNDSTVFILNEKNPGLLIRLSADYKVQSSIKLNFASDYSGIFHENETNILWILSDQSKTINKCNLVGKLIESYSIDVAQAEGIAVTDDNIYSM